MNFNTDEWYVWEQNASPMLLIATLEASFPYLRKYLGSCFFNSLIIFEANADGNYQGKWIFRHEEGRVLGQKMVDMLMCMPYRNTFNKQFEIAKTNLIKRAQEIQRCTEIEKCTTETLLEIFEELYKIYCEFYKYGWFTEPLQWQSENILTKYIKVNFKDNSDEVKNTLFTIKEKTFALEIMEDLKDIQEKFAKELSEKNYTLELMNRAEEHSNKYYWKKNNYFSTKYITAEDVINELLETKEIKIESNEKILDKKGKLYAELPSYYKGIVDLFSMSAMLGDVRKSTVMTANSAFDKLLKLIAERMKVELEDIKLLIPQELKWFIEEPSEYKERFELRKKAFMVMQTDFPMVDDLIDIPGNNDIGELENWTLSPMDEPYMAEGEEVKKTIQILDARLNLLKHGSEEAERLKGITTYYNPAEPTMVGKVRIIRNPKIEKIEEGEILVAPSTTPDYIDSMNKCKAIITDWGGQTSHAAIVSREMKKPCIIGTNFASSILKNGDEIKIDLEKGTIEVI